MENPGEEPMEEPAADSTDAPAAPPAGKSVYREILETVLLALVLALIIRAFLFESFLVQGNSMDPTLVDGERLLVNKFIYQVGEPAHGDIVVFQDPHDVQRDFIKRVIGLSGDRVEIRFGQLYVNGERVEEPYVAFDESPNFGPVEVPAGHFFVLGDNRQSSRDSRSFGPVEMELIKGRALVVFWPPGHARLFYFPARGA